MPAKCGKLTGLLQSMIFGNITKWVPIIKLDGNQRAAINGSA